MNVQSEGEMSVQKLAEAVFENSDASGSGSLRRTGRWVAGPPLAFAKQMRACGKLGVSRRHSNGVMLFNSWTPGNIEGLKDN